VRGGVEIEVCGRKLRARAKSPLLDALASMAPDAVGRGDYCRTGECAHCEVWLATADGGEQAILACQARPSAGMRITRVSGHLEADVLRGR